MRFKPLAAAIAIAWMSQTTLQAATITVHFTGNVSSVYNPFGIVGSEIQVGDPVLASLQYDPSARDFYPGDPTRGSYNPAGSMRVEVGGLLFEESSIQVDTLHNGNGGQELFEVMGRGRPTSWPAQLPTFDVTEIMYSFWQTDGTFTLLQSDGLATSVDFSRANQHVHFLRASPMSGLNMYEVQFDLSPVDGPPGPEPETIPEPTTAALFGGGLLLCCLIGAARKSARR